MLESPVSNERWHLLYERFGGFQFWLVDEATDAILAEGNSLPARLDPADLPDRGWEYVMEHATSGKEEPTVVSAVQVLIDRSLHGGGLSSLMLGEMRRIAAEAGFADLVAPVRPSLKSLYPLTPIERYVAWTTDDGLPFDPWLRVHARAGASIIEGLPRIDADSRHGRRLARLDGNAISGNRHLCRAGRATADPDRRRIGHRNVCRAERLDASRDR